MRKTLKLLLTTLYHIFIRPCRNFSPDIPFRDQGTFIPLKELPEGEVKILRDKFGKSSPALEDLAFTCIDFWHIIRYNICNIILRSCHAIR